MKRDAAPLSPIGPRLGREGVAAYYDRLAPVYGSGELFAARRTALRELVAAEIRAANCMLDLGCGNGAFLAELAGIAPQALLVGIDLSPEMLRHARQRVDPRTPLLRGDATALPIGPARLAIVFMSHVLLLIPDIEACITAVAGCLAPGGTLIATVGAGEWREVLERLLDPDELRQVTELFGSGGRLFDQPERVAAACTSAGLVPSWRHTAFVADWPAVEEWMRIRWSTIFDDDRRARLESWLAAVGRRARSVTLEFSETVLVATRR